MPPRRSRSRIRTGTIAVDGLPELSKALKAIGPELQKELRTTNKQAAEMVASGARSAMAALGRQGAHFAPGVKASGGTTSAGVALDGRRMPGILGVEFGAGQDSPRQRSSGQYVGFRQFEPWRGNGSDAGYALYPTIRDRADEIVEFYDDAIAAVIRKAGLDE